MIDWKAPFLHHYSAASSVCVVAEGAESSQLLHQSQFVASTGAKKTAHGAWKMLPEFMKRVQQEEDGKEMRKRKQKKWYHWVSNPRTHPDNRKRLRVSRRVPLRQRSVCNSLRLGHHQRTVDAQHKINPKKCQLSSWKCKKDPNGLYETSNSCHLAGLNKWGNHTAQYSEFIHHFHFSMALNT